MSGVAAGWGPVEPLPRTTAVAGTVLLVITGLAAGLLFGMGRGLLGDGAVLLLAGVLGVVLATVAAVRFWAVLVVLFALRASLDAFKPSGVTDTGASLDPGVVTGLVFVATAVLWLVAQRRAGRLHPPSGATRWFVALAAVTSISALGAASSSSLATSLKVWAGALMVAVLEQVYRDRPERVKVVLAAGGASMLVPAVVAVAQLASPRELDAFIEVSRIRGTFVHANPFATYLVVLAVTALALLPHVHGRARLATGAVLGVGSVLTLFTYARGAWLALMLGVVVVGALQDRRLIVGMVVVALAALLLVPSVSTRLSDLTRTEAVGDGDANSLTWRIGYWERLLPLAAENPVTGIGIDQVMERSPERLMPHNSFVQALVELGVAGLVTLLGLLAAVALAVRDVLRRAPSGLYRGVAVAAAGAGAGWALQLATENLLTQAAIFWYLAGPVAFVLAVRPQLPAGSARREPTAR